MNSGSFLSLLVLVISPSMYSACCNSGGDMHNLRTILTTLRNHPTTLRNNPTTLQNNPTTLQNNPTTTVNPPPTEEKCGDDPQCPVNRFLTNTPCPINMTEPDDCTNGTCPVGQMCCKAGCRNQCLPTCCQGCGSDEMCSLSRDADPGNPLTWSNALCLPRERPPQRVCPIFAKKCSIDEKTYAKKKYLYTKCDSDEDCRMKSWSRMKTPGYKCCKRECFTDCLPSCPECEPGKQCTFEFYFKTCHGHNCTFGPRFSAACRAPPLAIKTGVCPQKPSEDLDAHLKACFNKDQTCPGNERCCFGRSDESRCAPVCKDCPESKCQLRWKTCENNVPCLLEAICST